MLKRWHFGFDPCIENIIYRHIWILLPYFSLSMWHRDAFEDVGNHLGCVLHVGEDVLKGKDKRLGRMLVEIDVTKGFLDEIEIKGCERSFI